MTAPPVKKACDACHRRKVRCSGGQPCNNCGQVNLQCTYLSIPQKKGPKGSRAKVLSEIRDGQQQVNPPPPAQTYAEDAASFDFNLLPQSSLSPRNPALLSTATIENCITFYFTSMYTTSWILDRQSLLEWISSQLDTDAEVYCLAASLCAFVMVQPGMNLAVAPGSHYEGEPPQNRYGYANMLLDDVIRIRKEIDYIESPTLTSVQVSFFLFSCYFTLEKQNVCWFHLREAATLAQIMRLHEESSYLLADPVESMYMRRTYWLLFVTERAYSMERHRPLTLHPTIELPTPQDPEEEDVISGFLYLISLFRCIDDEFMALWNKAKSECSASWLSNLQRQLSDALPVELKTTESQAADVRITSHWLRIMVWQLSIANGYLSFNSQQSSMTFTYPIEVARDLIQDIQSLSLDSMEVHGIGLIEKLFDIACTLTDVIFCVPLDPAASPANELPSNYLNQFLKLISQLRGGTSRYFPLLLAKVSENLPSIAPPPDLTQMSIKQGYAGASDDIPTPTPPSGVQFITSVGMGSFGMATPQPAHNNQHSSMFDTFDPNTQGDGAETTTPQMDLLSSVYPGITGHAT